MTKIEYDHEAGVLILTQGRKQMKLNELDLVLMQQHIDKEKMGGAAYILKVIANRRPSSHQKAAAFENSRKEAIDYLKEIGAYSRTH